MKIHAIIMTFSVLTVLLLASCQDILTYDPHVNSSMVTKDTTKDTTKIDTSTGGGGGGSTTITQPKPYNIPLSACKFLATESYYPSMGHMNIDQIWIPNIDINSIITIDTSKSSLLLTMKISGKNDTNPNIYHQREIEQVMVFAYNNKPIRLNSSSMPVILDLQNNINDNFLSIGLRPEDQKPPRPNDPNSFIPFISGGLLTIGSQLVISNIDSQYINGFFYLAIDQPRFTGLKFKKFQCNFRIKYK
ncbi:MAG: hypothetical protein NT007_02635 [Candidatus Kapabacteria bacterium]|nr:hypothetical protein [Candidatus Kapabacteria bacterium]